MMKLKANLQRGFSLITAIFLLVVLAGLGAVMVTFFAGQQQGSTLDAMGSRAYQAARAGIEWGAYTISVAAPGAGCAAIPVPLFAANSLANNLSPFAVTLACTLTAANEGGVAVNVYYLTSTASNIGMTGTKDFVERSINATIRQ
jgi:MSHA biogenesis protein MshP